MTSFTDERTYLDELLLKFAKSILTYDLNSLAANPHINKAQKYTNPHIEKAKIYINPHIIT